MPIQKLTTVDAFVARDFELDTPARGIVRSAPKILQGGAKELARSQTYQCALFEQKVGGASAGINAGPDGRADAITEFGSELGDEVASGTLTIDAGKGVDDALLRGAISDPRPIATWTPAERGRVLGAGIAAAIASLRPDADARIAIEGVDALGEGAVQELVRQGLSIVAVSGGTGSVHAEAGLDADALLGALGAGDDPIAALSDAPAAAHMVYGTTADVLLVGSKMGALDHKAAPHVQAPIIVPHAPIPYTTKGAIMVQRADVTLVPDIIATAGPFLAESSGGDVDSCCDEISTTISALMNDLGTDGDGLVLNACHRAESFLSTWREQLPFGRPFAP